MEAVKQVYLLLICQGSYLGSVCQRWTFPERITALVDSCVEIPCTYDPAGTSGPSSTVWYLYDKRDEREILNTKDPSAVIEEYRNRTSLVPGNKSCTLRIDPVRREDGGKYYYPGVAEHININAYKKQSRGLYLDFSDYVNVQLYVFELMLEGDTTSMLCTAYHKCGSSPPSLQWNIPGNVTHQSEKISRGSWKEKSKLTYIPSYVDNGSPVQCTATYPNGLIIERNKTMNVYYDPKHANVTIIGMDEVIEGSDVTLQCNSFANPAVYFYEWYIGKNKSRLRWESGREITVRKVTRDMEPYSCTARNSMGSRESALTHIPVLFAPENVSVTVIEMEEVMEGSDVTLQCNSFFKPEVNEYEWYKGKEKSRLPETGREITVRNVTRDMEPYSCTAINPVGRGESALTQIPVLYEVSGISNIIFLVMIGVIGLLLLVVLLVYYCQRLKHFQMPHITT